MSLQNKIFTGDQLQTLQSNGFIDWIADDFVGFEPRDSSMSHIRAITTLLASCPPNERFFETQLRSYFPHWGQYCKSDKVRMVSSVFRSDWSAVRIRRLLDLKGPIQREHIRVWDEDGISLLHWSIMWFGRSESWSDSPAQRKDWTQWSELLIELISATDNLHLMKPYRWRRPHDFSEINCEPTTFLLCFFRVVNKVYDGYDPRIRMKTRLSILLGMLTSCGVDLEEFGRREFDIWEHKYGAKHMRSISCVNVLDWNWTESQCLGDGWYYPRWTNASMVAIHYGPKQEDWFIEWDRYWDYAEVFWNMVENVVEVEVMPGSWIDDEPSTDEWPLKSSYGWVIEMC